MELFIEQLQEQDIILLGDISDETSDIDPKSVKVFLAEKQNIALVAKLNGKVIGLLYGYSLADFYSQQAQFYVYSIDIHAEYCNKGYGSQFMQLAIKWAKDNGFRKCYLSAEEENKRARRVYEKMGMTVTNTREYKINFSKNE